MRYSDFLWLCNFEWRLPRKVQSGMGFKLQTCMYKSLSFRIYYLWKWLEKHLFWPHHFRSFIIPCNTAHQPLTQDMDGRLKLVWFHPPSISWWLPTVALSARLLLFFSASNGSLVVIAAFFIAACVFSPALGDAGDGEFNNWILIICNIFNLFDSDLLVRDDKPLFMNNRGVVVSPVPEKNTFGRFDDQFVEQWWLTLEKCIQKTANHPVLGYLGKDPDMKTASVDQWGNSWRIYLSDQLCPGDCFSLMMIYMPVIDCLYQNWQNIFFFSSIACI